MRRHFSASALSDFEECPAKHFMAKRLTSDAMSAGNENHEIIAKFWKEKHLSNEETEYIRAIFNERFVSKLIQLKDEQEMRIEWPFSFRFSDDIMINGTIDKVAAGSKVAIDTDWKTGKRKYRDEDLKRNIQAILYSLASFEEWPHINETIFELAMTSTFPPRCLHHPYSRADIPEMKAYVSRKIGEYMECEANKVFPSKPGDQCQYCGLITHCAQERGVFDDIPEIIITSPEELELAIDKAFIVDPLKKRLNDAIKAYLEAHQDVADVGKYAIKRESYDDWSVSKAKAAVEWFKAKFPDAVNVSQSQVRDYLLENEDLKSEAMLKGWFKSKSGIEIEWDRKKPE